MRPSAPPPSSPLQIDIANQLVQLIREGQIQPGEHLTEQKLARQFRVSRSPVRAALRQLVERNFLELRANAGVFVAASPPPERADDNGAGGEQTATDLYQAIISDRASGELGDIFTEAELISRYSVPKSLLTRALLRINSDGLATRRKGHGWAFLPALDSAQAKYESYRFRMMVECGGLREKSFTIDAPVLAQMRRSHEQFIQLPPSEQTSGVFFEMNTSFHETLARFSGNRFVVEVVSRHNRLRRLEEYRRHADDPTDLSSGSCQEHLEVIEALESGDTDWAALLLHRHLMRASRF